MNRVPAVHAFAWCDLRAWATTFVTHSLRRFFKTTCLMNKVPPVVVDRWMWSPEQRDGRDIHGSGSGDEFPAHRHRADRVNVPSRWPPQIPE